ncbi:MAG TPA: class I SAM-dependent methyltransferase, partial [Nitrosospira sp.]|nr:class I SAM-dependent methyltransferase [Nitrosospira sp.]
MSKLYLILKWNLTLAKWNLTRGEGPQTYLSAKWISVFLNRFSERKKRKWALRVLSLSPHYFTYSAHPAYRTRRKNFYLEREFEETIDSRQKIYDLILKGYLDKEMVVLDYGCGPGVLARIVSDGTKKVYGCDISTGVLTCAEILSPAPNLEYVISDEAGMNGIPDGSVDVVYSFAVIQHLSREAIEIVFENCYRKLKPGGKVLIHVH